MRLQHRTTRETFDAHWESGSNPLLNHPTLILKTEEGEQPLPSDSSGDYLLVVATLAEMRTAVDNGYRFHEVRSDLPDHAGIAARSGDPAD